MTELFSQPALFAAERVGIYVACNTAAHLAFNGAAGATPALAALAALRATAPTSVAYGVAMQAAMQALPAAPSIFLATALAPAVVAACAAPASAAALAARAAVFARAAARNLPVGAAWAAEWAAYAATRDALGVRVAKSERKSEHSDRLGSRFAIGAASIGAVCAAMAPFRAVPWIGAQVASRMIRSKVWWYGSYEALKAAASTEFKLGSRSAKLGGANRADGGSERERRVASAGDAMRVARATAMRPKKLREIPRIKRGALKPPGGSVHLAIHARGFVL